MSKKKQDQFIWPYIKTKSLEQILGYSSDVDELVREIKRDIYSAGITDLKAAGVTEKQIRQEVAYDIQYCANLIYNIKNNVTVDLKPHELRKFFPYLNKQNDPIYFDEKDSKRLTTNLLDSKNDLNSDNLALIEHQFVLTRPLAAKLLNKIGNEINVESETFTEIHKMFDQIRSELDDSDYTHLFDSNGKFKSDYRREAFLDYIFSMDYNGLMPVTHDQLWQFIEVADEETKQKIFKKKNILETDNIDLNIINWDEFFNAVIKYNQTNKDKKIKFKFKPYQNTRVIFTLPLEQALQYEDMFIHRMAGVAEKSLQTSSRAMIAVGQMTKSMQILSMIGNFLIQMAVFIKSFLLLPILAIVLFFSGRKSYNERIKLERKQHKTFLLNALEINELRGRIKATDEHIQELAKKIFGKEINIDQKLSGQMKSKPLINDLQSPYSPLVMKPFKARFHSKWRKFKQNFSAGLKKITPFLGPTFAGLLTAGAIFIIASIFTHIFPILATIGGIALLIGVGVGIYQYRTKLFEKNSREILRTSEKDLHDLRYKLTKRQELETQFEHVLKDKITSEKNTKNELVEELTTKNDVSFNAQVKELTRQRNKITHRRSLSWSVTRNTKNDSLTTDFSKVY